MDPWGRPGKKFDFPGEISMSVFFGGQNKLARKNRKILNINTPLTLNSYHLIHHVPKRIYCLGASSDFPINGPGALRTRTDSGKRWFGKHHGLRPNTKRLPRFGACGVGPASALKQPSEARALTFLARRHGLKK